MLLVGLPLLILAAHVRAQAQWRWPNAQLDALDHARWDQNGYNALGIATHITPCDKWLSDRFTGRENAADFIRTAFHDVATFDQSTGLGGLDASIRFVEEQSRPENPGDGFDRAFSRLKPTASRHVSLADIVALGLVYSVENCGGPEIPFRGGRVDASEPNVPGVPEPHQDLPSHIAAFSRLGFTQEEMIGLVACGHTIGGVQNSAFPNLVPKLNDPKNTQSSTHFDSTDFNFDNTVATEYISGTTTNPLVVAANDTMNSDKRIFAADGNVTMSAFARSPELFADTCAKLFARMINIVPRDVEAGMTDIVQPLSVRPHGVSVVHDVDAKVLSLSGEVRLWSTANSSVQLAVARKDGAAPLIFNATHSDSMKSSAAGGRYNFTWYGFAAALPLADAPEEVKFWFIVDGKTEDQGGAAYAIQRDVVHSSTSCRTASFDKARWDVVVRSGTLVAKVFLEVDSSDSTGKPVVSSTELALRIPGAAYDIWSVTLPPSMGSNLNVAALLMDGSTIPGFGKRSIWSLPACTDVI
ncbi:heme peroxidase [Exidia glandulosa HHB12029]|uniref:Peroxidase n=1 Tax=Exidia glandulosa HHB12029 TaxID=1314781 RepID=A0A165LKS9_EXIGL|nr:heme peroxidase [Exidia glandulosa HHB12029]